jgi:hypothetical protein
MNGYDLYPAGNFLFLPLSLMAYGVPRYRLMDIRSILLQTASWLTVSSLIVVPNAFFMTRIYKFAANAGSGPFTVLLWNRICAFRRHRNGKNVLTIPSANFDPPGYFPAW